MQQKNVKLMQVCKILEYNIFRFANLYYSTDYNNLKKKYIEITRENIKKSLLHISFILTSDVCILLVPRQRLTCYINLHRRHQYRRYASRRNLI